MALRKTDISPSKLEYYYDTHPTHEDLMGDSLPQVTLFTYLLEVLKWLYHKEGWMVAGNFNHYHEEIENSENLIVPDIALFKGIEIAADEQLRLSSWDMRGGKRQCPPLVLEVSSGSTYSGDINPDKKPRSYGLIGVKEYFSYDPNEPQVYPKRVGKRLLGWRYGASKQPETILPDERGWLWSEELESWLGEDGAYLRLYDRNGEMRPTEAEAEQAAKEAAWAKLRELGIDPEQL
ncbi:MAG: Uma2 family endonuclease [Chloroflexi bacterium]|uniref:Uma2 family endonuclease n=1 Tax=Candidatus Chlorohelix allophototropha TaxID=3003348 RepID=A0A8T7M9A7_9CHLR|nr:Uma2 family endonuclease [Chloroflexota bacterium]WJW68574.1 Uma2 family endonuclease [Chloroflexota bacterium L227-S17]